MPYQKLLETRLKFLNIDQQTLSDLREVRGILEPAMDEMLENFYAHINEEPELKSLFIDQAQVDRARTAQKNHWMEAMFKGKYDNAYYERTLEIGRAHARVGLTPNWYIGGYAQMLCQFVDAIQKHCDERGESAISLIQSISKIVFLDMDLVIHCYLDAKDESMRKMLANSTDLRVEMWKFSDELNAEAAEIHSLTESLSSDVRKQHDILSEKTEFHANDLGAVHDHAEELLARVKQLQKQTRHLEEHLKSLPLSEKLYLPQTNWLSNLKDKVFRKTYHHH